MSHVADLIPDPHGRDKRQAAQQFGRLREGVVDSNPADETEEVWVLIPRKDGGKSRYGPCPGWVPRLAALPTKGDRALVGFDDENEPWLLAWWPS